MKFDSFRLLLMIVALSLVQLAFSQEKIISGTVTDDSGIPLPGVNIIVKGTDTGTNTDFDGKYSISAEEGETLVFSFVGFQEQENVFEGATTMDVTLVQDSNALEEVVVTAFGRKITRNESTSSVSAVKSEDIESVVHSDAREAMQGKITGLNMNASTGTPGAEPEIRIRGINSITASNDPLYVVDGVPINAGAAQNALGDVSSLGIFALINAADIEDMTVLKDASAVAPYGADGANGVILITTKRGSEGKTQFSLNTSVGIQNDARTRPGAINAQDKLDALHQAVWNSYGNGDLGNGTLSSMDQIDGFYDNNLGNERAFWEELGFPDFNWVEAVRNKNALVSKVNFSVSQGKEESDFYANIGYNKTESTTIGGGLQRFTGSINYGTKFGDRFDFRVSANVGNIDQDVMDEANLITVSLTNPNFAAYNIPSWLPAYNDDGTYRVDPFREFSGAMYNPIQFTHEDIKNVNATRAIQNSQLSFEILDNLTFKTVLGLDYTTTKGQQFSSPLHTGKDPNGRALRSSQTLFNYTTQNSIDYSFNIEDTHHFNLLALQEYSKTKDNYFEGSGENFPNAHLKNLSAASANWRTSETYSDQSKMRYVGLLSYNFNYKYLLDASYSYQGDSRFSKKFDSFYSIGAAWNMDKEGFIEKLNFVDRLRIRAGYGLTGNAGIDRNQYQELISYGSYRDQPASNIDVYGTDATWEKSRRFDLGTEFSLFAYRLSGSIGFYANETTDMLLQVPIPYTKGFVGGRVLQNNGEMTNRGVEIELGGDIIKTDNFNWYLHGSFSTFSNKVKSIPEGGEITEDLYVIHKGHKLREWFLPEWAGVDPDNGDPLWYVDRTKSDETTSLYSEAERNYQGTSPLPKFNASLDTRIEFKNIFLDATIFYSGGNQIYDFKQNYTMTTSGSTFSEQSFMQKIYDQAWVNPGDDAEFPRFDYNDSKISNATNNSTHFLYDGDYIRLKDITLGYNFDKKIANSLHLDALNISVQGQNLWTWVKDKNLDWDPEVPISVGQIFYTTPPVKSIVFNLNLKF